MKSFGFLYEKWRQNSVSVYDNFEYSWEDNLMKFRQNKIVNFPFVFILPLFWFPSELQQASRVETMSVYLLAELAKQSQS